MSQASPTTSWWSKFKVKKRLSNFMDFGGSKESSVNRPTFRSLNLRQQQPFQDTSNFNNQNKNSQFHETKNGTLKGKLIFTENNEDIPEKGRRSQSTSPYSKNYSNYKNYESLPSSENSSPTASSNPSDSPDSNANTTYVYEAVPVVPSPTNTDDPSKIVLKLKKTSVTSANIKQTSSRGGKNSKEEELSLVASGSPDEEEEITFGGLEGFDKIDTAHGDWLQYVKFVMCHLGLLTLLVGYTVLGAYIFVRVEQPMEQRVKYMARNHLLDKEHEIVNFILNVASLMINDPNANATFWSTLPKLNNSVGLRDGTTKKKPAQNDSTKLVADRASSRLKGNEQFIGTVVNPISRALVMYRRYQNKTVETPKNSYTYSSYNNQDPSYTVLPYQWNTIKLKRQLRYKGHTIQLPVTTPEPLIPSLFARLKDNVVNKTFAFKSRIFGAQFFKNRMAKVSANSPSVPEKGTGRKPIPIRPLYPIIKESWDPRSLRLALAMSTKLSEYADILLRNAAHFEVQNSTITLKQNLWTLQKATFFSATVISTIGYGNIAPHTVYGRVFCILYAIFGIPLLFLVVADLGTLFAKFIHFCWVKFSSTVEKNVVSVLKLGNNELHKITKKIKVPKRNLKLPIYAALALMVIYMSIGAGLFTLWEDWSFFDSFYFVFITMTTIGFGDVVPVHTNYLLMMMIYILIGLATMTTCIELVIHTYTDKLKELRGRLRFMTEKTEETLRTETIKKYLQNPEIMNKVRKKLKKSVSQPERFSPTNKKSGPSIDKNIYEQAGPSKSKSLNDNSKSRGWWNLNNNNNNNNNNNLIVNKNGNRNRAMILRITKEESIKD